jgi:hypothetical protein
MKCHKWTNEDENRLLLAINECEQLFKHFEKQNKSYGETNVWDAIAGRMLPTLLTGAACKRHFEIMNERENSNTWEKTSELVEQYEQDLSESIFDKLNQIQTEQARFFNKLTILHFDITQLRKLWED